MTAQGAGRTAGHQRLFSAAGQGLVLLSAFWLIVVCCATPERGARLFDQGRIAEALPLLEAAARDGSAPSAYRLGLLLEKGRDIPQDLPRALTLFTVAAAKNNVPSMVLTGDLLRKLHQDDAGAVRWYRRAAARGDAAGMARLGSMLLAGQGLPADTDAALYWLGHAAAMGNPQAATALGGALLALFETGDARGNAVEAAHLFQQAGDAGDPEAKNRLADLYATGRGVPRQPALAASLRKQAADAGYAPAAYALGLAYLSGEGVTAYPLEAARLFSRAADAGYVPAMLKLADMYFAGLGVFRDPQRALTLYDAAGAADVRVAGQLCRLFAAGPGERRDAARAVKYCGKAARAGEADAAMLLGLGMLRGHLPGDKATGTGLVSQAAWAGNPEAMYAMALLHLSQEGVAGNPAEAFRWCRLAAQAGLPEAKTLLAALSEEEFPSAANLAKAMEFYREAARAGDSEAGFALGSLLSKGLAGPPDFAEARKWYEKAAAAGDARAQFNLGLMYLTGKGGPVDDAKAFSLMLQAAQKGDPHARFNVASMALSGRGTAADPREAFGWYRLAAGQGFPQAQAMLAGFYYEGRVVPRDLASTLFWLTLASRVPGQDALLLRAAKARAVLEKQLSPEQLEHVRQRLAAYAPAPFDPEAEKALLAAIKFLPPSARGPGFPTGAGAANRLTTTTTPPPVDKSDSKALF